MKKYTEEEKTELDKKTDDAMFLCIDRSRDRVLDRMTRVIYRSFYEDLRLFTRDARMACEDGEEDAAYNAMECTLEKIKEIEAEKQEN